MTWRRPFPERSRRERDLDEEIQSHLNLAAQDRIRNGETPEHAAVSARREFGNTTLIKEVARDVWGWTWLDRTVHDLRYGFRSFSRTPGTTAVIVLTLALGIGASTAIFSIIDAVLLKPLPYRDSARLVAVWDREIHERATSKLFTPYRDFMEFQRSSQSFEQLGGATWATSPMILTGRGPAKNVLAIPSTLGFFSLLGVSPALGRTFEQSDLDRACTVVLAHKFWQSALGGQAGIIGQSLALDNQPCIVVGVMPAGFSFYPDATSMWRLETPNGEIARNPERRGIGTFARLKPGVTISAAQEELRRLHRQFNEHNRHGEEAEPAVYPLQDEFTWLTGRNLRLTLLVLFGAVNFVLLIACVNVANLLLGRFVVRQREFAIRAALGSGRGRLLRQLLTESILLSTSAAILGTALAIAAIYYFRALNPIEMPPGTVVEVNFRVLLFTVTLAVLTTLLFGLFPAWKASTGNLDEALKSSGRSSSQGARSNRTSRALVVAEVMLSLQLLAGAGLLIDSVVRFSSAPLGFSPQGLTSMAIGLPRTTYADDAQRLGFYERVADALQPLPGLQQFAFSTTLPVRGIQGFNALSIEGRPDPPPANAFHGVGQVTIDPAYFAVIGLPLERGRNFEPLDRDHSDSVAIVNEALAKRYFPNEDPIGKRIRPTGDPAPNPWLRIVGVAANEKRSNLYNEMTWVDTPTIYHPLAQHVPAQINLLIRSTSGQAGVVDQIRQKIATLDPGVPVDGVEAVEHLLSGYLAFPRFRAVVLGGFAVLALLLALVGIYGVLAQAVAQRTREIGIRMALGATRANILKKVATQGMLLTGIGIVLGLGSVWALSRLLAALLYGVGPTDPMVLGLVTFALLGAALLATYLPARRATQVDPMVALRYE
jgi:putative ABC transport system permease protein